MFCFFVSIVFIRERCDDFGFYYSNHNESGGLESSQWGWGSVAGARFGQVLHETWRYLRSMWDCVRKYRWCLISTNAKCNRNLCRQTRRGPWRTTYTARAFRDRGRQGGKVHVSPRSFVCFVRRFWNHWHQSLTCGSLSCRAPATSTRLARVSYLLSETGLTAERRRPRWIRCRVADVTASGPLLEGSEAAGVEPAGHVLPGWEENSSRKDQWSDPQKRYPLNKSAKVCVWVYCNELLLLVLCASLKKSLTASYTSPPCFHKKKLKEIHTITVLFIQRMTSENI